MERPGPRTILIGGTYRALCVLERLLERGERVVAFIGQEGGEERDFCPEILEICDRHSIPARSAHKLGEEIVRWLEDRVRPDLALAVGADMEIPLAVGGNARLGMIEVIDRFRSDSCKGVVLRQRGQDVLARELPGADPDDDGDAYLAMIDEMTSLLDEYLDGLPRGSYPTSACIPFHGPASDPEALERAIEHPEPGPDTDALERELADYVGADAVLALRSVAEAWSLLFEALGLQQGDEVVLPGLVSRACAGALSGCGARASWVDVEPRLLTAEPEGVAERLGEATRALVIAHAFGQPAALNQLYPLAADAGIEIIEDGGPSLGARFEHSRLGRSPCTTVFHLNAGVGDACCVTLPSALAERVQDAAAPLRLGDGAACIARRALARRDDELAARRRIALAYSGELSRYDAFRVPATPHDRLPTYASFVLGLTRYSRTTAEDLHKLLCDSGIETRRIALGMTSRDLADLPVTEQARLGSLLLPVHDELSDGQLEQILDAIFGYAIG